jgi:hypothetical protein
MGRTDAQFLEGLNPVDRQRKINVNRRYLLKKQLSGVQAAVPDTFSILLSPECVFLSYLTVLTS